MLLHAILVYLLQVAYAVFCSIDCTGCRPSAFVVLSSKWKHGLQVTGSLVKRRDSSNLVQTCSKYLPTISSNLPRRNKTASVKRFPPDPLVSDTLRMGGSDGVWFGSRPPHGMRDIASAADLPFGSPLPPSHGDVMWLGEAVGAARSVVRSGHRSLPGGEESRDHATATTEAGTDILIYVACGVTCGTDPKQKLHIPNEDGII